MGKLGIGLIIAFGAAAGGFFAGGYLGDALWFMANDYLPECKELEESKQNKCVNENRDYYAINTIFLFGGTIIPFMAVVLIVRQLN